MPAYDSQLGTVPESGGSDGKESACNTGVLDLIPGLGRSPGEGNLSTELDVTWELTLD